MTSLILWNIFKEEFFICTAPRARYVEGRYIKVSLVIIIIIMLFPNNVSHI